MKRKLLVLMAVLMAAVSPTWAYVSTKTTEKIDGIYYDLYPNGDAEVGLNSKSGEGTETYSKLTLVIPSTVTHSTGTYKVTAIVNNAFQYNSYLTTVTIETPSHLKEIGDYAFSQCRYLTSINIPEGVTSIGDHAFSQCDAITNLTIPSTVQTIKQYAFYGSKKAFTDVTLNSVTSIGENSFYQCHSMTSLVLPSSISTIPTQAFYACSGHTSVTIPEGVKTIERQAFQNCWRLTELTIPSTVTSMWGSKIFDGCTALKKLYVLSETAPSSSSDAFGSSIEVIYMRKKAIERLSSTSDWKTQNLEPLPNIKYYTNNNKEVSLTVTSGYGEGVKLVDSGFDNEGKYGYHEFTGEVTTIPENAFQNMTTLTRVEIPRTVDVIGNNAFSGCTNLDALVFFSKTAPTNVSSTAFDNTTSLSKIYVREVAKSNFGDTWQEKQVEQLQNIKYTTTTGYALYPTSTAFGANVSYLGSFYDGGEESNKFGYLEFLGSPTEIPTRAFEEMSTLSGIELPNTVTTIGEEAFGRCSQLKKLNFPIGVTTIGTNVFLYCTALEEVTLPSTVTTLGNYVFNQCTGLSRLYVLTQTAPKIKEPNFFVNSNPAIFVREIAMESFKDRANRWYEKNLNALPNIQYTTSDGKPVPTDVLTGDGKVKLLGNFYDGGEEGNRFGYLELRGYYTEIPANAFKNTNLTSIVLPYGFSKIGADAFDGCSLTSVTCRECTLDGWCKFDFGNAAANPMSRMAAGTGTVKNGDGAALFPTELTISNTAVKNYTFVNSNIQSLTLTGVESIGDGSFKGCSSLATINVGETPASLGTDAFDGIDKDHVVNVPISAYTTYTATAWNALNLKPKAGAIELSETKGYEIDQPVAGCDVSYTRTFTKDCWQALFLPISLTYEEWSKVGEVAKLTNYADGELTWTMLGENEATVAGTPYIIKPKSAGVTMTIDNAKKDLAASTTIVESTFDDVTVSGTYSEKTMSVEPSQGNCFWGLSDGDFYYTDNAAKTLRPFRIFLIAPKPAGPNPAPIRIRIVDAGQTAIEALTIEPLTTGDCMYNLSGQKVDTGYRGIVIVNGKKMVRK